MRSISMIAVKAHMAQPCEGAWRRAATTIIEVSAGRVEIGASEALAGERRGSDSGARRRAPGSLRCSASSPRARTRCAHCVSSAQTTGASQCTKRAARAGLDACAARRIQLTPALPRQRLTATVEAHHVSGRHRRRSKAGGRGPVAGIQKPALSSAAGAGGALARSVRLSEGLYPGPSLRTDPHRRAAQGTLAAGQGAASPAAGPRPAALPLQRIE